jgi:lactocepin
MLILALLLPGFVFANNQDSLEDANKELYKKVMEKFEPKLNKEKEPVKDNLEEFFKDEDEVRIIVELKSEPSIVYATNKDKSYEMLSNSTINDIERKIDNEQQKVKANIRAQNIDMKFIHSFNTAFNGFSGKVKFQDIALIEKLPSVKKVYIANEYERPDIKPDMDTSNDMIGSRPTWDIGYKGEGTVIAIIDTGIDPSHKDMVLSQETEPKLTRETVEGKDLLGKYYTEKVPYGYNYYDLNNEILDLGPAASMHGMHVAGTAGANGDVENDGIKGVAPESQLLAMKVFSNDPIYATTFSDIYLAAIDEAIKLGADVLNMSLGSTASFYIPESAEDVALRNATNNGIVCSVSAGNSAQMTDGYWYPWKDNPDIGVVGAPGLNKDTIQVASIENTHQKANYLMYNDGNDLVKVPMAIAGNINPAEALSKEQEFVDAGSGHPSELTNAEGKVALVIRGGLTGPFVEKIENAQRAGAVGIIIYNHGAGGEELINMATPATQTIPAVFIGNKGGMGLLGLDDKKVTFSNDTMTVSNPSANEMSDFTSWGTTPSLELKPEITAPGGKIYSTLNNDKYGTMSGTSMAAPHVAGGSGLVMQYIKNHDQYKNLSLSEQTRLSKVFLMNTAELIYDPEAETYYSPRRQGAGLMNINSAVTTPVRVVNKSTNEAKVELKDFESTNFTMTFKAINDTDEAVSYSIDVKLLTDFIYPNEGEELNLLAAREMDFTLGGDTEITIPANGEEEFTVTVDFSGDRDTYRNMFVEGFVILKDPNDTNPTLSVPYVGFYGDWGEPKILDGMNYIDPEGSSYFESSGMIFWDSNDDGWFYGSPHIYMNPGTEAGYEEGTGNIMPYLSFMRNAEVVNYNILDKDGELLRTILSQQYIRKNYIDGGRNSPARLIVDAEWDGTVKGKVVPDGDYFYEIAAKVHYDGAEMQSKRIPITIDTTGPKITNLKYNKETKKLTWDAIDEGIGIAGFMFAINDELLEEVVLGEDEKTSYELDMGKYIEDFGTFEITVISVDQLYNMDSETITYTGDNYNPYIFIMEPRLLDVYNTRDILFEGYVANYNALDKVIINENVEADIEFMENVDLYHPDNPTELIYSGPAYKFTKTLTLEDGYQEIRIEAISKSGDSGSLVRRFYVDTTPPELEISLKELNAENQTADLEITMKDSLGYLKLFLEDSQIFEYEDPLVIVKPANETIIYTVNLEEGENTFVFTLVDTAGNRTIKKILITDEGIVDPVESEPMENLPYNTIILGKEAFNISYINNNEEAQQKLIKWYMGDKEVYFKVGKNQITNDKGQLVGIDALPDELIYYDEKGDTIKYTK